MCSSDLYPGIGPEHSWLKESGRVRYDSVTDVEALPGVPREMYRMWRDTAVLFLKTQGYGQNSIN